MKELKQQMKRETEEEERKLKLDQEASVKYVFVSCATP